jgi:putative lipoprotein
LYKLFSVIILLLGAALMAGCSGSSSSATVTGTVTYLQKIALPSDAVVKVQILDVSKADAPAEVIGEQVIETKGAQVPFSFTVPYDSNQIVDTHTYSLQVRIEDATGTLLFINDTIVPVITRGNPTQDVEVIVVPVNAMI